MSNAPRDDDEREPSLAELFSTRSVTLVLAVLLVAGFAAWSFWRTGRSGWQSTLEGQTAAGGALESGLGTGEALHGDSTRSHLAPRPDVPTITVIGQEGEAPAAESATSPSERPPRTDPSVSGAGPTH